MRTTLQVVSGRIVAPVAVAAIAALAVLAGACSKPAANDSNPTPNHETGDPTQLSGNGGQPAGVVAVACQEGGGDTYEVGDGKKYASLGAVPFEKLGAGDRVLIHWRAEPYREKVLLSASGKQGAPIQICGVPGPDGQLPVISGVNATTRKQAIFPYLPTQERGLVIVTVREGYKWGDKPSWIVIQNLDLRSAYRGDDEDNPNTFTDNEGVQRPYSTNSASLFVERGEHITVRNCLLHDSAYGLFVASADTEEVLSREILVEGSYIYGNGTTNVDRRHNVYTEAAGVTFQGNRFGPQRPGARGNQIKDRSAGTVIRYNWIEGGAHLLDLVEPEEAWPMLGKDERYHRTYVYGNVMISGPNDGSSIVHYGGDNGITKTYRKGTLYFFHNTVVVRASEKQRWNSTLFRLETDDETVDARNNVIWKDGSTHLHLMKNAGHAVLGTNWVSSGYGQWQYDEKKQAGTIKGEDALITGGNPGFVNAAEGDFRLATNSKARGAGGALPKELAAHGRPTQYQPHQRTGARKSLGSGADLGAFGDER